MCAQAAAPAPRMGGAQRRVLSGLASVEASLGPPQGSLGVIQEADEEAEDVGDEGESAPAARPAKQPAAG